MAEQRGGKFERQDAADPNLGMEVAGFRIEGRIGRGGMGVVYRARDIHLDRAVALKILPPELAQDDGFRKRFIRESRLASSIDHPNIVPIYRAGEHDGLLFIVMRYVEGSDLKTVLRREGALGLERSVAIVAQLARALDAAHARGLVHRDVKPGNVLVVPSEEQQEAAHIYLTDFGLTKPASSEASMTDSGAFLGTVEYAAPEQIEGAQVDARTDVYSLGCLFYECLTGRVPFEGPSAAAVMYAHLFKDPPSVTDIAPELPSRLDAVMTTAMARNKDDRYATCRRLVVATREALNEPATSTAVSNPSARQETVHEQEDEDGSSDPVGMIFKAFKEVVRDKPSSSDQLPVDSARRAVFDKVRGLAFERFTRPSPPDSAPPEPAFSPPRYLIGFQSLAARSKQLQKWLLGSALLDAAIATIGGFDFMSIARSSHPRRAAQAAMTTGWITGVQVLVFLTVALMFVVWFYRAYTNLPHLGIDRLRFSRVWALASWVIPVVNLWRPKQIMNDIWRASDPERPAHGAALWRGKAVPVIFLMWWCALVGSKLLGLGPLAALIDTSVFQTLGIVSGKAQQAEANLLIITIASGLSAIAGLLGIRVVGMTSARQEARLEKLLTPPSDRGAPTSQVE
ncbi:MAG: protein kinase [Actinobacteria bacterium]|nr:protein kinase [Actinomycetota bacterium]